MCEIVLGCIGLLTFIMFMVLIQTLVDYEHIKSRPVEWIGLIVLIYTGIAMIVNNIVWKDGGLYDACVVPPWTIWVHYSLILTIMMSVNMFFEYYLYYFPHDMTTQ